MTWRYVGAGAFLAGVPARDLTDDEMDAAEVVEPGVRESGLYQRVEHRAATPTRKAITEEAPNGGIG